VGSNKQAIFIESGLTEKQTPVVIPPPLSIPIIPANSVIESQIDGDFEGWEGDTIFKLMNGQIWQQSSYDYTYHYSFMPDVIIYPAGSGYKMHVDGVNKDIYVKRLK